MLFPCNLLLFKIFPVYNLLPVTTGIPFGIPCQTKEQSTMLTLILVLAGLAGFALFFKSIDFFEKI